MMGGMTKGQQAILPAGGNRGMMGGMTEGSRLYSRLQHSDLKKETRPDANSYIVKSGMTLLFI